MAEPMLALPPDWLRVLPPLTRFSFCGDASAQRAAAAALGLPVSAVACRAHSQGGRTALWLGPDEWLLLAPAGDKPQVIAAIATALAALPHSLVDISQRQVAYELRGPQAAWLLNAQCPLDLSPQAFPVGMCTRTLFAKTEIVLWRTAPESFHVEVFRSFADYLTSLLHVVAQELAA